MILNIFRSIQDTVCSKHEFPRHFLNNIDALTMENIASQEEGLSGSLATLPLTSSPVCDHSCTLLLCGSPASSRWLLTYWTQFPDTCQVLFQSSLATSWPSVSVFQQGTASLEQY